MAVHRERLFEDYVCRIIDAEQYETFSKQDAETEKEIQNNMEILLKHQVGYEKNFHTEEEFISSLFDNNVNIDTIRETAGHADERTSLNNYCFNQDDTKELEAKLEECKNAMTATFQITS